MVILIALWWSAGEWYDDDRLHQEQSRLAGTAISYASHLSTALEQRLSLLRGLSAFVTTKINLEAAGDARAAFGDEFDPFVASLFGAVRGLNHFSIAPRGIQQYVYPLAGNESALGRDLINGTPRPTSRDNAPLHKTLTLVGPFLAHGGVLKLEARQTLFRNEAFWGFVGMTIDLPTILDEVRIAPPKDAYRFALKDAEGRVFLGDKSLFAEAGVRARVDVGLTHWELAMAPAQGWNQAIFPDTTLFRIIMAIVAALMGTLFLMVAGNQERLEADVAARTQELEREIAERKLVEQELLHAQKMEAIGVLAGGVAHDFNNILGVIIGYTQICLGKTAGDDPQSERLEQIFAAALRGRDLVAQLMTFSRQTGETKKRFYLETVVKEVMTFMRATLPATLRIETTVAVERGLIDADPTQIHQLIMNLCANAAQAMRDAGGLLSVGLSRAPLEPEAAQALDLSPGDYYLLQVDDTGAGIPPETLERIFDPFFTTKQPGEGTGLGLSVAHGVVVRNQGAVRVDSAVGRGTRFRVWLPAAREGETPEKSAPSPVDSKGEGRILLVDDETTLLNIGTQLLEELGFEAVVREDPQAAWELFQNEPDQFTAVITDMTMPGMTGKTLGEKILALRPETRVIITTGYSDAINEDIARRTGFARLMYKPVTLQELADALKPEK